MFTPTLSTYPLIVEVLFLSLSSFSAISSFRILLRGSIHSTSFATRPRSKLSNIDTFEVALHDACHVITLTYR